MNAIDLIFLRVNTRKVMAATMAAAAAQRAANRRDPEHPDFEPEFFQAETAR